jgi:HK97 family phage prohead protease
MTHHNKAMLGTFKAVDGGKGLTIEGWANKAVVDRGGDIIPKSAWQLDNFKKNAIILWNHDKSRPIGKAQVIEAKEEGLYIKARISSSADAEISKIRDLIKEGVLNAFSVGFDLIDAESIDKGITEIKAAELFEVSIVSLPMNQDSLFVVSKSYDYDEVKAQVTKGADDAPAKAPAEDAEKATEETKAADEPAPEGEANPSDEATTESQEADPSEKKELELEVQAIKLPKAQFPTQEEATAWAEANDWSVGLPSEEEGFWVFNQLAPDEFASLQDISLDDKVPGMVAVVGQCMDEGEDKSAGETAQKQLPTVPLPSDAPVVDVPEALMQARQTNVMLGQVVGELQALREAITALANAMPPKQVSPPVEVAQPNPVPPPVAQQMSLDDDLANDAEIVRQYVQEINKTLARIGA